MRTVHMVDLGTDCLPCASQDDQRSLICLVWRLFCQPQPHAGDTAGIEGLRWLPGRWSSCLSRAHEGANLHGDCDR